MNATASYFSHYVTPLLTVSLVPQPNCSFLQSQVGTMSTYSRSIRVYVSICSMMLFILQVQEVPDRVAELGSLSLGAKMAMKIFVKRVFTIFA